MKEITGASASVRLLLATGVQTIPIVHPALNANKRKTTIIIGILCIPVYESQNLRTYGALLLVSSINTPRMQREQDFRRCCCPGIVIPVLRG